MFIFEMVCMPEVIEIKSSFAVIFPKCLTIFPLIKLTEIADNETCPCFNNTPDVYRDGLLQPHSSLCAYSLGLLSYGPFLNALQSPSVWACVREALTQVPYGGFDHFIAHESS